MAAKTLNEFMSDYYDTWGTYPTLDSIWNAATRAAEEKFSATNSAMVPCLRHSEGALCVVSDQWKCKDKACLLLARHQ